MIIILIRMSECIGYLDEMVLWI